MGYMKHDAIIVTSWHKELIGKAHTRAQELNLPVTDIGEGIANTQYTFLVVPDGSKEGWPESDQMNIARESLQDWIKEQAYDDGSSALDSVAIRFGGDDSAITVMSN